ncbi:hypothetical protein NIES4075_69690 [Tolypothrix sp. NIES-4075]|uniref:hypothetical protein n=1 Tax=Tolypothrix sp. NIES-4075 TaxID=2005459 RepID=UPI000B629ABF|nr:hypothetical protein [Tolypothrix sp. NIES-4075]GAX45948.1 hypothetical protein NIES4075_69690 [Tolypothrix sp. NIES-4075]
MNTDPLLTDAEIRTTKSHTAIMKSDKLREFRQAAYKLLGKAHDATFELTDVILTTRIAYSLADFSLSPFFRRKWPSIYEALQDSRPQRQKLMQLYIKGLPKNKSFQEKQETGFVNNRPLAKVTQEDFILGRQSS